MGAGSGNGLLHSGYHDRADTGSPRPPGGSVLVRSEGRENLDVPLPEAVGNGLLDLAETGGVPVGPVEVTPADVAPLGPPPVRGVHAPGPELPRRNLDLFRPARDVRADRANARRLHVPLPADAVADRE